MPLFLCPNCNVSMQPVQRAGIELDVCPQCRGVWLDRGELEQILDHERLGREGEPHRPQAFDDYGDHQRSSSRHDDDHYRSERRSHDDDRRNERDDQRRKKFSIFDIFD
jgi:uncharacterized protein